MTKVNVLGTIYKIYERTVEEDYNLNEASGYCDKTTKTIVVLKESDRTTLSISDFEVFKKKCIRHEIVHAFMFESGLHENWEHPRWGQDETTVDWIACQFPKLLKAFEQAKCL